MDSTIDKRQLRSFHDLTAHERRKRVKRFEAITLYYIHRGRNAWHETWVTHYFDWSFQYSLLSAKREVERHRSQGSVFYIYELPALAIHTTGCSLILTQINQNVPLDLFSPEVRYVWDRKIKDFVSRSRTGLYPLRPGITLGTAADSFDVNSDHWYAGDINKRFTYAELWEGSDIKWEPFDLKYLTVWRSRPQGSEYAFGWDMFGHTRFDGAAVRRIARSAQRRRSNRTSAHQSTKGVKS